MLTLVKYGFFAPLKGFLFPFSYLSCFYTKNKSLINIRLLRGEKVCLIIIELI